METPYRKDCSQGLAHVHKDLFSIQKWTFKYKLTPNYACPHMEVCGRRSPLQIAASADQSTPRYRIEGNDY
jgi:hypothetical protein